MEVIIMKDSDTASRSAASVINRLLREKPDAVLGLATGSTPIPLYKELVRMHREEGLDFSQVTTFNLDEYIGLPRNHKQSYNAFMWDNFLSHININPDTVHIPDGMATDIPAFCQHYEQQIVDAGGIDLQILGIGSDGHVGFNEPSSSFASRTRIKTLTEQTVHDNARFFDDHEEEVPRHCITMGIGTIMDARMNLLLAFGAGKAKAIASTVEGPVSSMTPASILQHHPHAKIFVDEAAASSLNNSAYYDWVYARKPAWQKDA
ncbi:glucosamine-6-phosphate deaminase [Coraliomargarita akajimensis]|uniref:Glucosamine-6-phosphate deaminase n=1 Tax=Coraliomargarita akajimensis (strain DSM 45221 / IAM 15411 / JCM 23193 / KCTC 12865 / 04OKA010-24) TaxID=583355 RepID=D5ENQ7_CORAD|nr:glucosamine-6-phosphate deaminase [Coraliomargarita akajimensis]ADE53566.1 glucosamine-6-phosphate isomerase [Coraliomargarita akajimensis DSM 45221]